MRRSIIASLVGTSLAGWLVLAGAPALAQPTQSDDGGVKVKPPSMMRNLVPAAKLEKAALEQYGQLRIQAMSRNALVPADDPVARRVAGVAHDLLAFTHKWNARAKEWQW